MKSAKEILEKLNFVEGNEKRKLDFGYEQFNEFLSLLPSPCIMTLGGFTGTGRTSFALNLVLNLLKNNNCSVMYISKNETAESIMKRLISIDSKVPLSDLCEGDLKENQKCDVFDSINLLNELPFHVYEVFDEKTQENLSKELLREFNNSSIGYEHRVLIYDDYHHEKHVIEELRKELKKYNITLLLVSLYDGHSLLRGDCTKLKIHNFDCYIANISDVVMSICRPSEFNKNIDNSTMYLSFIKNKKKDLGMIKYEFNPSTFVCNEIGVTDEEPPLEIKYRRSIFDNKSTF